MQNQVEEMPQAAQEDIGAPDAGKRAYHFGSYIFWSLFSFTFTAYAIFSWFDHPVANFVSSGIIQPLLSTLGILEHIHQSITFAGFLGVLALASTLLGVLFARDAYWHYKYWVNPETVDDGDLDEWERNKMEYFAESKARHFASWIFLCLLFSAVSILGFAGLGQDSIAVFVAQEFFIPLLAAFKIVPPDAAISTSGFIAIAVMGLAFAILCAAPCILTIINWIQTEDIIDSDSEGDEFHQPSQTNEEDDSDSAHASPETKAEIARDAQQIAATASAQTGSLGSSYVSFRQPTQTSTIATNAPQRPVFPSNISAPPQVNLDHNNLQ